MSLITYKGISQNSSISKSITDEEFASIEREYYQKPDFELVRKQLKSVYDGGTRTNHIYDYYFKEVMSKAIGTRASWSIWDGIRNREIMEYFAGKVDKNKKVFPDSMSLAKKIETAFRLCGIRYCVKLPNFPLKTVVEMLKKYNVNGNYYDFSCGWGARLLGSLQCNVNYFGVDPNDELCFKLRSLASDYEDVNPYSKSIVDIRCQGSQTFVPKWENKMGIAFSSPPYFSLEDYQIGDGQSYKKGMTYREWSDGYIPDTVRNIWRYLIPGGYFLFNVKDFRDYKTNECYPIASDFIKCAKECGFEFVGFEELKNIKRCHGDISGKAVTMNDNAEKIHVFRKPD